jgi:hypothetical protein
VQIIAGSQDLTVPPVNAELLDQQLPNSKPDVIDAGHFAREDAADEYAALVTDWLRGGYAVIDPAKRRSDKGSEEVRAPTVMAGTG